MQDQHHSLKNSWTVNFNVLSILSVPTLHSTSSFRVTINWLWFSCTCCHSILSFSLACLHHLKSWVPLACLVNLFPLARDMLLFDQSQTQSISWKAVILSFGGLIFVAFLYVEGFMKALCYHRFHGNAPLKYCFDFYIKKILISFFIICSSKNIFTFNKLHPNCVISYKSHKNAVFK